MIKTKEMIERDTLQNLIEQAVLHGEAVGKDAWYGPEELRALSQGAISAPDAALISFMTPVTALGLLRANETEDLFISETDMTEKHIVSLLTTDKAVSPAEIQMRGSMAMGALSLWGALTKNLVDAATHASEHDRLDELVQELASAMRAA